jgi:hypothetical protein
MDKLVAELVAAMRESLDLADRNCFTVNGKPHRSEDCQRIYNRCVRAIRPFEKKARKRSDDRTNNSTNSTVA